MIHYHLIQSCVAYQAYEFDLSPCSLKQFKKLRTFIETFGENINPPEIGVLHITHPAFFIAFPSYGYPVFKISFYQTTPTNQVKYYLGLLNEYYNHLLQP